MWNMERNEQTFPGDNIVARYIRHGQTVWTDLASGTCYAAGDYSTSGLILYRGPREDAFAWYKKFGYKG